MTNISRTKRQPVSKSFVLLLRKHRTKDGGCIVKVFLKVNIFYVIPTFGLDKTMGGKIVLDRISLDQSKI